MPVLRRRPPHVELRVRAAMEAQPGAQRRRPGPITPHGLGVNALNAVAMGQGAAEINRIGHPARPRRGLCSLWHHLRQLHELRTLRRAGYLWMKAERPAYANLYPGLLAQPYQAFCFRERRGRGPGQQQMKPFLEGCLGQPKPRVRRSGHAEHIGGTCVLQPLHGCSAQHRTLPDQLVRWAEVGNTKGKGIHRQRRKAERGRAERQVKL